jgi:ethanolamine ammonia-lyase small subunit
MKPQNPWDFLRQFTHARIGIGRSGDSIPTKELLRFRLAFSRAKDSVWSDIDFTQIIQLLCSKKITPITTKSACSSKEDFLLNPSLGRTLDKNSESQLDQFKSDDYDCALIIADGLSANGIYETTPLFLERFLPLAQESGIKLAPVVLAHYARVGLSDEIGSRLNSKSTLMLIGERPGLACAKSLSLYFTYKPNAKNRDSNRNCISNIHEDGLSAEAAAHMAIYLVKASLQKQLSGVALKVEYPALSVK